MLFLNSGKLREELEKSGGIHLLNPDKAGGRKERSNAYLGDRHWLHSALPFFFASPPSILCPGSLFPPGIPTPVLFYVRAEDDKPHSTGSQPKPRALHCDWPFIQAHGRRNNLQKMTREAGSPWTIVFHVCSATTDSYSECLNWRATYGEK